MPAYNRYSRTIAQTCGNEYMQVGISKLPRASRGEGAHVLQAMHSRFLSSLCLAHFNALGHYFSVFCTSVLDHVLIPFVFRVSFRFKPSASCDGSILLSWRDEEISV